MEKLLGVLRPLIPRTLFNAAQPAYHWSLAGIGALWYRFPSRKIYVIGVTGTKGKTSTTELTAAILEAAGHRVSYANTNRIMIAGQVGQNKVKRSMLGRTRLQHFLRRSVDAGCEYAVVEMTSEGAKQFRHAFIDLDALIFTNLSPEHIESHGSYENYVAAKVSLAKTLEKGEASKHTIVANADDAEAPKFLAVNVGIKLTYRLKDAEPYTLWRDGSDILLQGEPIHLQIPGDFNIMNALAAATFCFSRGIDIADTKRALESFTGTPGRMERIEAGQDFTVIVDYAHTADSLEKVLGVYANTPKICIMGGTGGGRDTAKRKVMGEVADKHSDYIILTTEDPYDERPEDIAADVAAGIHEHPYELLMDRRDAIRKAFRLAKTGWVVFITGRGADPYIMGPNGSKIPWSDAAVAREELAQLKLLA